MFNIHTDKIGDMAVVECEGRIVRSDAAFKLRDAVTSQADANIVVVDLSEVYAVEGGGLGETRCALEQRSSFAVFYSSRRRSPHQLSRNSS